MLVKSWKKLSNIGVTDQLDSYETRFVVLINRFAVISGLICFINIWFLMAAYNTKHWLGPEMISFISTLLFLIVLWTNKHHYYTVSRWIISWLPPIVLLGVSVYEKRQHFDYLTIQDYYSYRFMLMATAIIPILINRTNKKNILIFNLLPSFIGMVFFEIIHKALGVGIHQMGFGYYDSRLYIFDVVVTLAYLAMIGFLLNQRAISDKFEVLLNEKQDKLKEQNKELSHMNSFINEQNYEMNAQSEKLIESHDALLAANKTIEKQKKLLQEQNQTLEGQVEEKTKSLSMVNEELLIRNNELRQFSHTLSHNLKSPVATFQGLLNLVDVNDLNASNKELLKYLNESVCKMQEVFTDMNQMLEIRNTLYNSIEDVDLQKLMDSLHNHFYQEFRTNDIGFQYNFSGLKTIRTNEKQLSSILFHLISNSIKFRSEIRKPEIDIMLKPNGSYHHLTVKDNGQGIDLQKYASKLFYPYQQFHREGSGKGLGLYLVKLQTESLGGNVKLSSEPDNYTEVEVKLRK